MSTIRNQNLMVPFEDGLTGRILDDAERPPRGEAASFLRAERPGVSGDGMAAQRAHTLQPDRSHENQHW